jgi:hypothetical protein
VAARRPGDDLGEDRSDVGDGDGLHQEWWQGGDLAPPRPSDHRLGEVVELGGALDGERHGSGRHELFLQPLAGQVRIPVEPVDPDDREQHMVAHPSPLLGREEVPGAHAEEVAGRRSVRRLEGADVDDPVDAAEGVVETLAADHVDPAGPRDHDRVVAGPAESLDGVPPRETRPANYCDTH